MAQLEVTLKAKLAVRKWGRLGPTVFIFLDTKLEHVRSGNMLDLLVKVNEEYLGSNGFPISSNDWANLSPETVRDIRDEARRRIESSES